MEMIETQQQVLVVDEIPTHYVHLIGINHIVGYLGLDYAVPPTPRPPPVHGAHF